jgi:hypothetical protein
MTRNPPLFRRVIGGFIDQVPACVHRLHDTPGKAVYRGEVVVARGAGRLSRLFAWATSLPPAGEGPVEVEIVAEHGRERWTRSIGGRAMRSTLWAHGWWLRERLGLATFDFHLSVEQGAIVWRVAGIRILGLLPLPARWFADVLCRESGVGGRYRFDVRAALPGIGLLVHYRGWLEPA